MRLIETRVGRWAEIGLASGIFLGISNILWGPLSLTMVVASGWVAWRTSRGLWARAVLGAAGGALAGVAVLGPGFRLAMRVVAIADPRQVPEFSIGGTMVVIIGVGAIAGGAIGVAGNLLYDVGHRRPPWHSGLVVAMLMVTMLLSNPGIRGEMTELGRGLVMNLTMFGLVSVLYGLAAMRLMGRFASTGRLNPDTQRSTVRA